MTAEAEKAKELVDKFYDKIEDSPVQCSTYCYGGSIDKILLAEQCAKICVEEILAYHHSLFDAGLGKVSQTLSSEKFVYNDVMNPREKYLKDVLNEIEKL